MPAVVYKKASRQGLCSGLIFESICNDHCSKLRSQSPSRLIPKTIRHSLLPLQNEFFLTSKRFRKNYKKISEYWKILENSFLLLIHSLEQNIRPPKS